MKMIIPAIVAIVLLMAMACDAAGVDYTGHAEVAADGDVITVGENRYDVVYFKYDGMRCIVLQARYQHGGIGLECWPQNGTRGD